MQSFGPVAILSTLAFGLALALGVATPVESGAFVAAAGATDGRGGVGSQCLAGETILYSCRFGRSVGSVCAAGSRVHYRFGPPGRPDIDLASADDWSNVRVGRVVGQEGGHQSHIRFTRGRYHYIVFEGADGAATLSPGRRYSGIHVAAGPEGSERVADLRCRGGETLADDLSSGVIVNAPAQLRSGEALWEQQGGPFDAWF